MHKWVSRDNHSIINNNLYWDKFQISNSRFHLVKMESLHNFRILLRGHWILNWVDQMVLSGKIMEVFTILRKWNNLEGAYLICISVAVQTLSQYNNLMHREAAKITISRQHSQLIRHRIRGTIARTAELLGFVIPYDSMQGRLGLTTRLLLKMVNLSLNRRLIIKFSKNSSRKTQTQEIKQLKQFIIMGM